MKRRKITKIRKIPSKIKKVISEKEESGLEEDIEESEEEQFNQFISTGRAIVPVLETGQEITRQNEQTADRTGGNEAEESQEQVTYGPRQNQDNERKYESVILQKESNIIGSEEKGLRRATMLNQLSQEDNLRFSDRATKEIREKEEEEREKYRLAEESGLKTKRSRGWNL